MSKYKGLKCVFNSLPDERWKPIKGFPLYYISNFGRVWSDKQNAPKEIRHLQRWVNNRYVFYKTQTFDEYKNNKS